MRFWRPFVAAAVAVAIVVGMSAGASDSASRNLSGRIIFTRAGGHYGDETLFIANADGSHQRRLTGFGSNCCPRISRDGTRILLAAPGPGGRVTTATVATDGTGLTPIPLPDATLNLGPGAWAPDGKRIAFQGWDDSDHSRNGIYIGDSTDGGNLKRLTSDTIGNDIPGDFSPDGKRLAFFSESPHVQSVGSVWLINLDGTGLKQLTPKGRVFGWGTVRWSPDGTKILFANARTARAGALWTVRPDGTHLTKLFQDKKGRFAISPTWSPNGSQIMFALDPIADEYQHPPNGLYVINKNGTGLKLVIGGNNFKREPDWVR
jgi:Tol biopolymer transport system component